MPRLHSVLCLVLVVAGCADFPELDDVVSERARRADYPLLQPVDDLIATALAPSERDALAAAQDLAARAARLRARAATLRRPLISAADRRRMAAAVARHNS